MHSNKLKTIPESIKKFVLIGLSLFLLKSVLIVYAYVFNPSQYNLFNQSYYTASLLILFGSMGFDIAQTRIPIKTLRLLLFISVNVIVTYFILHIISNPFSNFSEIIPVIIYSTFAAIGNVLNFKLLFNGKYQIYFWITMLFAVFHFLIVPIVLFFHISIFPVLSVLITIWFMVVYKYFDKESVEQKNITQYFKIGFSAFVINSAVSLGLAGDKFIANHFFTADIANAYTFAWSLTVPIFYIGNIIEKYLFAEPKPDKNRILKKGFLFSVLLIFAYTLSIIAVINFFPSLLPASISKEIFSSIFTFMITGYSLYVVFHFPLNTYLFKVVDTGKQKIISIYYSVIILIFVFIFYYITGYADRFNYQMLLTTVWVYIFILLIVKAIVIFKDNGRTSIETREIISNELQEIP